MDLGSAAVFAPTSITVCVWAKATGMHNNQCLISKYDSYPGSWEIAFSQHAPYPLFFRIMYPGDYFVQGSFTATDFNDGRWHHIAGTYDATTGTARLYVDGTNQATAILPPGDNLRAETQVLRLGKRGHPSAIPFSGLLGFVQIYDPALSSNAIAELASHCGPAYLSGISLDSGTCSVRVVRAWPGVTTVLERTDSIAPPNWSPITNLVPAASAIILSDSAGEGRPSACYRLLQCLPQ